jgi:hypothetical protein
MVMPMHWIPWLAGGFLLTPFVIWFALAAFVFPGAWNGFDAVVGTSALGASLPLAAWFFLRGIGGFANAMAGRDPDGELTHGVPRLILRLLPLSALALGVIGAGAVLAHGTAAWSALAPLAVGLVVSLGIYGGEHGISHGLIGVPARLFARLKELPVLRDLVGNETGGRDWFLLNLVLLGVLAAMVMGAPVPVVTVGLMLVAIGFVTLYLSQQHRRQDRGRA